MEYKDKTLPNFEEIYERIVPLLEKNETSPTPADAEYLDMIKTLDYTNIDPLSWYQSAFADITNMEGSETKRLFVIH